MVLTLLPVSALAEGGTLQSQIDAIEITGTIILDKSYTEDISIPKGKAITLDLNGQTLTNSSGDTITVALGAKLTIKGDGTVDNVTHGKADIYNNGTVTLSGGRYTRSREADNSIDSSGGNSYYNILNHGEMTINKGVSLISSGHFSSLIASGYYNYTDVEKGERTAYISATGNAAPKLTINGGTFSGGINTIKNDDNATLIINDGTFSNVTQDVIQNNNIATINGGTFNADGYNAFENRYYQSGYNAGQLTVTNGNFIGNLLSGDGATTSISGGTFSDLSALDYLADGANVTVKLAENTTKDVIIPINGNVNLDLNGKTFTTVDCGLSVANGATLTVSDSGTGGKLTSSGTPIRVDGTGSKAIINNGTIESTNDYGIYAKNNGAIIVNGGTVTSKDAALSGNNTTGNMNFEVNGGTLTAAQGPAIYMPGQVNLTVTNGTLNGGISLRMGQVNISGGTINSISTGIDSPAEYYNYSGNAWLPDALYVFGGTYTSEDAQYGNSLNLNITGGTFNCLNDQGSAVAIYDIGKVAQTANVTISGGTFTANSTTRKAYQVLNLSDIGVTDPKAEYNNPDYVGKVNSSLTGGTYSADPSAYVVPGYVASYNGSTYTVYYPVPVIPNNNNNSSSTTTKNPDGSTTTTTTNKATGAVTETTTTANGSVGTVKTDANGSTEISASISAADVKAAEQKNAPVIAPITVTPAASSAAAPVIKLSVPANAGEVAVAIPVVNAKQGTVAVRVNPDGTEEIIKTAVITENGLVLGVKGSMQIKVINNSKNFADTVGHWAASDVDFVSARELFNGTAPALFSPEANMTRGMVVTVIARLAGENTDGGANWYDKGCAWAVANGVSDGTDPNGSITREQLAAMLYRYCGSPAASGSLSAYADAASVSAFASDAMQWCVNNGIINGMDGLLNPQGQATRAQVSAMFARYIRLAAAK